MPEWPASKLKLNILGGFLDLIYVSSGYRYVYISEILKVRDIAPGA